MNPLYSIISKLHEDDLVVVKLDIDTPEIENPMAKLLLEDDAVNHLVDHFYFEHHVRLYELRAFWGANPTFKNIRQVPTIADSFQLMNGLRKKGVAAHFWVQSGDLFDEKAVNKESQSSDEEIDSAIPAQT